MTNALKHATALLDSVKGKELSREERIEKSLDLAAYLVTATHHETTRKEKKRERWMARMVGDPHGRTFITAMTDQCFRSRSNARTADQLVYLIKRHGIPRFLPEADQMKFLAFRLFGNAFPDFFIPQIKRQIRKEFATVLLPETPQEQARYFADCRKNNIRINLNHLGEAILGEGEANRRLQVYLDDLEDPDIEYISIKISTIYSQINMVGWEASLERLAERLRSLYRAAQKNRFIRKEGQEIPKFVNLDMEEYKDLDLTVALFQKVLDEDEFLSFSAGIVLQSYLPDSFAILQRLTKWAQNRFSKGGAPIRIRLVKGANLALEAVESSLRSLEQPPFMQKIESDANLKRMLEFATRKEHAQAVHIGLGSHNLFDIAYCFILRAERNTEESVSFEMLEGMAEPMRRVIQKLSGGMLLYCPEAKEKDFQNAVAYLIRRLDENSGPENFLRHFFEIRPDNFAWQKQADLFAQSVSMAETLPSERRRTQNRLSVPAEPNPTAPFHSEPDTDFSLGENRTWVENIFKAHKEKSWPTIPLVIDGEEIAERMAEGFDPSRPEIPLYRFALAGDAEVERALASAKGADWKNLPFEERSAILGRAAQLYRQKRDKLIGAMIADGGKNVWEADPEVSEAIDFIEYYRKNWERILSMPDLKWSPKGTILVASPWNFPCSIPSGGIAAALTAGNSVLFKPALEAVLVGWELVRCFWEAGVPKQALQFLNCPDEPVGSRLIGHPELDAVILTGATVTARHFMKIRPGLDLHAETGGKNALIISALSDRDLAIKELVYSAFGHSGQKCSACSLAILEAELYDDPDFRRQLKEAVESLPVGSAWNPSSKITPLIRPPEESLLKGLNELEEGEFWLLEPKQDQGNQQLWSPGIKFGVKEGGFMHQTELFGPVLGVMRAESLQEAIRFANGTPYGLTSGIHTLDEREQEEWKEKIEAGNLYINRGITGAIVRRQPFGGCKASSFGTGAKAGGPNYVSQLAEPQESALPHERAPIPSALVPLIASLHLFDLSDEEMRVWKQSAENYAYWAEILREPADSTCLLGQDNYFYHLPLRKIYLRLQQGDPILPMLQVAAASMICETPLEISTESKQPKVVGLTFIEESEEAFFSRLEIGARIRLLSKPTASLESQAAQAGAILLSRPVLSHGRFELLHYLREVALSIDYHRYGYLGLRDPVFAKK
ncbi:MAG: proline dehydrogenase family protein [Chlamydiales bacterium]|nr:proline dehydrogenase family protein [Chlamydiales bacterium]